MRESRSEISILYRVLVRVLRPLKNLWSAAWKICGEENKSECEIWVKPLKEYLWAGEVSTVLSILKDNMEISTGKIYEAYRKLYEYFDKNKDAMRYKEFREKKYYIGNGVIESANKYVVGSRMKLTGCRWLIKRANAMVWLRAKYFEDIWDKFWDQMNYNDFCNGNINWKMII